VTLLMKLIILNCLFHNLATQIRLSDVLLMSVSGCAVGVSVSECVHKGVHTVAVINSCRP
jgi:hypothetical protein